MRRTSTAPTERNAAWAAAALVGLVYAGDVTAQPPAPAPPAGPAPTAAAADDATPDEADDEDAAKAPAAPTLPADFVAAREAMIVLAEKATWPEFLARHADPADVAAWEEAGLTVQAVARGLGESGQGKLLAAALKETKTLPPAIAADGGSVVYTFPVQASSGTIRPPLTFMRRPTGWVVRN